MWTSTSIVYSFGVGGDVTFERDLIKRHGMLQNQHRTWMGEVIRGEVSASCAPNTLLPLLRPARKRKSVLFFGDSTMRLVSRFTSAKIASFGQKQFTGRGASLVRSPGFPGDYSLDATWTLGHAAKATLPCCKTRRTRTRAYR